MISAASVSRALSRGGLRPLPSGTTRMREGVRVKRSAVPGVVYISVDIDSKILAARRFAEVVEILDVQDGPYAVERIGETSLRVEGRAV